MKSLTEAQERALRTVGNVLVVAGAGTGKTRTLVERCCLLLQEDCSLEQILMVTFTEGAAAEMRARIRSRLIEMADAGKSHCEEQIALLDTAHICTLHSFCLKLVRENFYHPQLRVDPNFVVLSDEQAHQLRHRTLDGLLESYYGGESADAAAFRRLVSGRARGADQRIREWIWRVHRYAQSLADPQEWFAGQTALYGEPQPGTWRRWFESGVQSWGKHWLPILESQPKENTPAGLCGEALKRLAAKPSRAQRGPTLREGTPPTEMASALHEILEADSDDKWPKRKKTFFREPLKSFFKEAGFLASLEARHGEDPLAQDWEWTRHDMLALLRATQEFAALYTRAKRESGGVDFADLEQFALKLLRHDSSDAAMDIAASWRKKLKYVFVDEYQDINEAQDAILRALSDQGPEGVRTGNRFLVGDVKQSIYRFRLADPAIFQSYKQNWDAPGSTQGQVVFLSENFRSREGLLDFVNGFFETVMREEVGGVSYDKKARLNFGAATDRLALGRAAQPGRHVELHLRIRGATDEAEDGDDEGSGSRGAMELADLEATEKEARMLALRLRELRERKEQVWDEAGGQFRDVEWRDMAVLLRAPAAKAEAYAKEFNRAGVPLHASRGGFYDATEISDLLGLLQLLDNPLQDLPLLAVLRSPLVGLTLDELAAVRLAGPGEYFWIALQTFNASARTVPAGLETIRAAALGKTRPFVKLFSGWRQRTRQGSVADCLDQVLAETGYEDILRALPRGEERRRNVRRLLRLARKFDPYQRQGLLRFLNFVETQRDAEAEEEPAPPATADAVRLLSIHQSKGLEFPIVALADLGKAFNMSDTRADFLLDSERGICPRVTPPGRNVSYPSLPYWLATQRQIRESLGEELRLLYVAMTRAKDRLVLAGSASASQALQDWKTGTAQSLVSTERILSCRNYWAWLQLWLTSATRAEDWQGEWKGANSLIEWTLYSDNDARLLLEDPAGTASLRPAPQELPEHLVQLARWQYPFERAAREPAKTSVTAQRRLALLENQEEEATKAPWTRDPSGGNRSRNRAGARPLSAAELGTAHHKFLQFVSLPRVSSVEDLRQEAIRLQHAHILSSQEAAGLNFEALANFWISELGKKISGQPDSVRRELAFTARFAPSELTGKSPEMEPEFVVVQGVVDLAVVLPRELWVVDFKTDTFAKTELTAKVHAYEPQLILYVRALERIFHRPVTGCWLHFLSHGTSVRVNSGPGVKQ